MTKIYEDYMAKVAVLLGANPKIAKRDMKKVMQFETNLAYVSFPLKVYSIFSVAKPFAFTFVRWANQ